jgi:hypothetical protein
MLAADMVEEPERAIQDGKVEVLPNPEPRALPVDGATVTLRDDDPTQ